VPIWADGNLPDLARAVRSTAVLAAVRDATSGTCQDESAAAPFADGRWLFSHNGAIPDWPTLPDDLGEPVTAAEIATLEARCDSVLLWLLLSRRLAAGEDPAHVLTDTALRVAAARPGGRLNLLLTDGRTITAVRHGDTLWYRTAADGEPPGVLVASEPDDRDGWREAPEHTLLTATASGVRTRPLTPAPADDPTDTPAPT
ncbi:class II glutamine amidotransferase, partial [Streptomyces durbertensis]